MRFVVLAKQNLALVPAEMFADVIAHPQLVTEPQRQRRQIGLQTARCASDVGFDQTGELDERLLVKADEIELVHRNTRLAQAVFDGTRRKARVVLPAGETLLLRGSDNSAILEKA